MIQTLKDKKIEIYSKDMNKICEMENAGVESKKDYIKVYNNQETRYFDKNGNSLSEDNAQIVYADQYAICTVQDRKLTINPRGEAAY